MLWRFFYFMCMVFSIFQLNACIPILFGTVAGGGAAILTDRRSVPMQTMDRALQIETERMLSTRFGKKNDIEVSVFNRQILLTGKVISDEQKQEIETIVQKTQNPRQVFNELIIDHLRQINKISDTTITSGVKTALLATRGIPSNSIRVTTSSNIVYLMGLMTEKEAKAAAHVASGVLGVQRVVKLFEYISREERDRLERRISKEENN